MSYDTKGRVVKKNSYSVVYSRPSIMSDGVTRLHDGDEIKINSAESTHCYYKIRTTSGYEGYVMICDVDVED